MSWLKYGVSADNLLVAVEDVCSGSTNLLCPYCRGVLTAKKGRIKAHHFAHTNETCREVQQRKNRNLPTLPLYDQFNIFLSGKELEHLQKLWWRYGCNNRKISHSNVLPAFLREELLEYNDFMGRNGGYQFTKLGKIPVGALSLMLFNSVQEPLLLEKLEELEDATELSYDSNSPLPTERLSDLRIYRASLQKILLNNLYYLKAIADGQTFYKIGVTRRPIKERVVEVEQDLRSHFGVPFRVEVLGTWTHRGNVEKYFKYRYARFNYPIGSLTEYYKFNDESDVESVLRDLRRMKLKVLSQQEQEIIDGFPSPIEQAIEADIQAHQANIQAQRTSHSIRVGMQRAAQWGAHVGRPAGGETNEDFLAKPSSVRVVEALERELSLRQAAEYAKVSVNTVRKVKAVLEERS
jgi:hypothetical protein